MSCPSYPGCASVPIEAGSIVGSAPHEEAYLLVEFRKPWPSKIKKLEGVISELRSVLKKHKGEDVKMLATPRIPWLPLGEGPRALLVRWDGSLALCETLEASPEALRAALALAPSGKPFSCYMVCTHGSRDPCCGLLGVPIYRTLTEAGSRPVLQVSHLGGHRFAPVLGAFPEWKFYGHLTPELSLEMDKALSQGQVYLTGYRGNGRLNERLQVVEAKLWEEHGSELLSLKQVAGNKEEPQVEVSFRNGERQLFHACFQRIEYEGYKSCKDFKNKEISKLKLPTLKSLHPASSLAVQDVASP